MLHKDGSRPGSRKSVQSGWHVRVETFLRSNVNCHSNSSKRLRLLSAPHPSRCGLPPLNTTNYGTVCPLLPDHRQRSNALTVVLWLVAPLSFPIQKSHGPSSPQATYSGGHPRIVAPSAVRHRQHWLKDSFVDTIGKSFRTSRNTKVLQHDRYPQI